MDMTHTLNNGTIAIGDEGDILFTFSPVIVILHNHQKIATTEFVFTIEHGIANALIIDIGTLVTSGDDHRFVHAHMAIATRERFDEFVARDNLDIRKALEFYTWKMEGGRRKENTSYLRGIPKDA